MNERIHLFSTGSQYADWTAANCERCTKWHYNETEGYGEGCDIEQAIFLAGADDGTVTPEIAARAGYSDPLAYNWPCREMIWTREAADIRAQSYGCVDFAAFARAYPARAATVTVEAPAVDNEAARLRVLGPDVAPLLPGLEEVA